ncbi:DUF4388 domain-containing protein, partial [Archangium sp.]|uniref:DUF4388 domain-containing protein n=1 Tax=Archangium sp. TaxID=1872627 RepID=UPI002D4A787C
EAFPRETWGDVVPPGPSAPAAPPAGARMPAGPPAPGAPVAGPRAVTRPPVPGAGVPVANPGAVTRPPVPGAGVPVANPGAMPPGAPVSAAHPPPVMTPGPGMPGTPATAAPRPAAPGAVPHPATTPGTSSGAAARPAVPGAPAQPAPARPSATVPAAPAAPATAPGPEEMPPASGKLETHSPVRLYGLIAAGGHTGLLTLTLADCAVSIHFRKGNPEFIDSSHPEDSLGTWLLQAKLVTPEQLQQAEAARGRFGGELLAALFGLGLLQPASAFTQLSHRAQAILLKGLRAESGSFTFEAKDLPAAKAMPLGNKWAVLSDLVRRMPSADLRRRLQPVLIMAVMKSTGRVGTGDLRLTPHAVRVIALIDGVRSVGQFLNDLPQDADHLLRLVFLLKELEGVSFVAVNPRAAPPPPTPPANATGPQPTAKAAPPQATPAARPGTPPGAAPRPAAPPSAAAPQATAAAKPAPPPPAAAPQAPRPAAPVPAAPAAAKPAAPATAPAAPGTRKGAAEIPALRELAAKM